MLELVEAAAGLPLRVVGDGPLRAQIPSEGFVPPDELGPWYERASVVAAPSRREGYGVVAREAMAWGRPVVASAVGGLLDAVEDDVTGLRVPPGDVGALRSALERLLGDAELRARLGAAARDHVRTPGKDLTRSGHARVSVRSSIRLRQINLGEVKRGCAK